MIRKGDRMKEFKCEFCKRAYELDETNIDKESKYMECWFCGNTGLNPLNKKNERR
jgi:hypothetical protein